MFYEHTLYSLRPQGTGVLLLPCYVNLFWVHMWACNYKSRWSIVIHTNNQSWCYFSTRECIPLPKRGKGGGQYKRLATLFWGHSRFPHYFRFQMNTLFIIKNNYYLSSWMAKWYEPNYGGRWFNPESSTALIDKFTTRSLTTHLDTYRFFGCPFLDPHT